jgi:hypothetical protein
MPPPSANRGSAGPAIRQGHEGAGTTRPRTALEMVNSCGRPSASNPEMISPAPRGQGHVARIPVLGHLEVRHSPIDLLRAEPPHFTRSHSGFDSQLKAGDNLALRGALCSSLQRGELGSLHAAATCRRLRGLPHIAERVGSDPLPLAPRELENGGQQIHLPPDGRRSDLLQPSIAPRGDMVLGNMAQRQGYEGVQGLALECLEPHHLPAPAALGGAHLDRVAPQRLENGMLAERAGFPGDAGLDLQRPFAGT